MLVFCMAFSACSLLPEEETFAHAPTVREYEGANYKTALCKVGDVVRSERLSLSYVPLQSKELSFSLTGLSYGDFFVQAGDDVKKGDILAELDMGDLKSKIDSLEDQKESLELSLQQNEEKRDLALKRSAVRTQGLSEEDIASARQAVMDQYDAAAESLNDRLYILNLRIEDYQKNMDERRLTAPFDGTVTYTYTAKVGETSQKGQVMIRMSDARMLLFRGETSLWDEIDYDAVYTITVNSQDYEAKAVTEAELNIPETAHTEGKRGYVYFTLTESSLSFSDNTAGWLELVLDHRENVLNVPNAAVTEINGVSVVYYLMDSGVRSFREVDIGLVGNIVTEIKSGVEEGEEVIVK